MQRYHCGACRKSFQSKRRGYAQPERLWSAYTFRRQTVANLADQVALSTRQVRRKLRVATELRLILPKTGEPIVVVLDTTYFDTYGVMVFRDQHAKRNLLWYFVGEETNLDYLYGLEDLKHRGYTIAAVVCDGKKWLCEQISRQCPVQHCQFHLMKTVTRYLTRRPEWKAGQELRSLVMTLLRTTEEIFKTSLNQWLVRWVNFPENKIHSARLEKVAELARAIGIEFDFTDCNNLTAYPAIWSKGNLFAYYRAAKAAGGNYFYIYDKERNV